MTMPITLISGGIPGLQFLNASAKLVMVSGRDIAMLSMGKASRCHWKSDVVMQIKA